MILQRCLTTMAVSMVLVLLMFSTGAVCRRGLMEKVPCWDTKGIGKEIYGETCYSCPVDCKSKSWVGSTGTCECFGCADSSTQCNVVELTSAQLEAIDDRV